MQSLRRCHPNLRSLCVCAATFSLTTFGARANHGFDAFHNWVWLRPAIILLMLVALAAVSLIGGCWSRRRDLAAIFLYTTRRRRDVVANATCGDRVIRA